MLIAWLIIMTVALQTMDARADTEMDLTHQPYRIGEVLHEGVIEPGLGRWRAELQAGGRVDFAEPGKLEVDVPEGATVWFEPVLEAPVLIRYDATVVDAGGANDRVSDLNCFWMATDPRVGEDGGFFDAPRTGAFSTYHAMRCYYVGLGGNDNTTTRFRRYIGDPQVRPLVPEHDLGEDPADLITPNQTTTIGLVVYDGLVQFWRDGRPLFSLTDPEPYTRGRFGLRTVKNHLSIENFRVYRLVPAVREPGVQAYRQTPQGPLKLHVFTPPGGASDREPRPGLVLFHGGGWTGGSPEQFYHLARWLAGRGLVVFLPEYRLGETHGTTPLESVDDAFAAMRYVRAHADELGLDPGRIAAGGGSAGGHLAAALATLDGPSQPPEAHAQVDPRPAALVLFNPVYDNSPDGYGQDRLGDRWRAFSPMHNLHADMPPTLVMLGTRDRLIPVETAERFQREMRQRGVRSELELFEGAEHGFFNPDRDGGRYYRRTRDLADAFLVSLGYLPPLERPLRAEPPAD